VGWESSSLKAEVNALERLQIVLGLNTSYSPAQEIKFLDKAMWLVDAGDYDNDGVSELVFSVDDYDRGGYKLFCDHFKKEAVFEFSYH
jgi:hypothetical protein